MSTDLWLGSVAWLTSAIAFLAAGTAVVRMLDARPPGTASGLGRSSARSKRDA